jgi:PAS domain S-box-containing protein
MSERGHLELKLLDQMPLTVVITTPEGRIAFWNRGAEALCGWLRRDVLRRPLTDVVSQGRSSRLLREAVIDAESGGSWDGELALKHRNGSEVSAQVWCSPLQSGSSDTVGLILVAVPAPPRADQSVLATAARVGRGLAQARKEAGLTQQELAERLGVTRRSIQGYESGSVVPYRHLDQLAAILGRSRESLVLGEQGDTMSGRMPPEFKAELRNVLREELVETLRRVEAVGLDTRVDQRVPAFDRVA